MTNKKGVYHHYFQDVNRQMYGQPVSLASPFTDAFGFIRTTSPLTIYDNKQLEDKQPLFWSEVESGGTAIHTASFAMTQLAVTGNDGDYMVRQTFQRIPYQPGRSQTALFTGKVKIEPDCEKRVGLMFGDKNAPYGVTDGLYWMMSASQMHVVESRNGVHSVTPQSQWNFDTLDGTGISKISASWDCNQIFGISYAWLGVGRTTYFLNLNGLNVPVHTNDHANTGSQVGAYISTPNLPIRYDLRSAGGTGSLEQICCQVASEGGATQKGTIFNVSTRNVHLAGNTTDSWYAVCGIRLTSSSGFIEPLDLSVIDESKNDLVWALAIDPVLTGSVNWVAQPNSAGTEVFSGSAQSITCHPESFNIVIAEGHGVERKVQVQPKNALHVGMSVDGTPQHLVLLVSPLGAGSLLQGSLTYRELL